MIRRTLALVFLLSFLPAIAAAQLMVRDDVGRSVIAKQHATRIVSLAPFLTEIAFAAGMGDLLVGVDELSEYPPEVARLARVKAGPAFTLDQIAPLRPDLVLAWRDGIRPEDVNRLEAFGTLVFVAQATSLEDVPRLMRTLANLAGRDGNRAARAFEEGIDTIRKSYEKKPRVLAFVEIWHRPLTTVSGEHFLSEGLELCRVDNVFKERLTVAPRVSVDDVNGMNPAVIVGAGSAANAEEFRANWAIRPAISAVKAQRLVYVDEEGLQRPGPRTPRGIARLCAAVDELRPQLAQSAPVTTSRPGAAAQQPVPPPAAAEPPAAAPTSRRPSQYGM